ncbi:hypothetical protein NDU88_000951 [Pleurodeles waltl]|uniref:Uncharacterized protein n=1 Tax=Pleurodeles waltl TaxID=8319 RepID=A0AAV7P6I2_PLEWA|nr:hypothetical protein NDU88_000951 [Pleurodeles waltl]
MATRPNGRPALSVETQRRVEDEVEARGETRSRGLECRRGAAPRDKLPPAARRRTAGPGGRSFEDPGRVRTPAADRVGAGRKPEVRSLPHPRLLLLLL